MNQQKPLSHVVAELLEHFAARGMVTSSAIARDTGINQSQIYRNLFAAPKRFTKTHLRLCEYANIDVGRDASDPRSSEILMNALASVWDGSEEHARRLAELLFAHSRAGMRT